MLTADTDSVVFGRTINAYRDGFGAGGSSGGEGVAVAMGASPLGIGNDGAGSVRMPAFANGVLGFRTSGYRWPFDGVHIMGAGVVGTTALGPIPVAGPLCRSVRDIQLITRVISDAEPWRNDPFLLPSPWAGLSLETGRAIRIGVWQNPDHVHLLPPVSRALQLARARLESAAGPTKFAISEFDGPSIASVWDLHKDWVQIQDIRSLKGFISTEPMTPIVAATKILDQCHEGVGKLSLDHLHCMNARIAELVQQMAQIKRCARINISSWNQFTSGYNCHRGTVIMI